MAMASADIADEVLPEGVRGASPALQPERSGFRLGLQLGETVTSLALVGDKPVLIGKKMKKGCIRPYSIKIPLLSADPSSPRSSGGVRREGAQASI